MRSILKLRKLKAVLAVLLAVVIFAGMIPEPAAVKADVGNYYIQINKGTNVVTVFQKDGTPYTAFVCSTGGATPVGTFHTQAKYRWWTLDGPSYGQYCTRITGSFLFHSVWYHQQAPNTQSYVQYNRLGTTASHGCTRLTTAASKWIYDNCPIGTTVKIFYGTEKDDPLGKPNYPATTGGSRGWDPTDPDPSNPYQSYKNKPKITVSNKTLILGKKFGTGNMTCKDSGGFDCTDWVKMSGKVNMKQVGDYPVTYSVVDSWGRTASLSVVYKVRDLQKPYISGVKKIITKNINATRNMYTGLKAKNIQGDNLTSKIKVYVKKPGDSKYKLCKDNYTFSKLGNYKVKYKVTNPTNKKTTTVEQTIKVVDAKKPKISSTNDYAKLVVGIDTGALSWDELMYDIKANLQTGKNITSVTEVVVTDPAGKKSVIKKDDYLELSQTGTYTLKYKVKNPTKNPSTNTYEKVEKTRTLEIVDGYLDICLYDSWLDLQKEEEKTNPETDPNSFQENK